MKMTLANLTAEQKEALCRKDLSTFIRVAFRILNPGAEYLHNWHIDLIADRLTQVYTGKLNRLIINIPPRYLKSISASVAFVAWVLGHDPTKRIICASYSSELSDKLARDTLIFMQSLIYQKLFPKTKLWKGRKAVHDFNTTETGYRYSVSTGGGMTGRGADILIIDDPLKPNEASSDVQRKNVNEWFDGSAVTRLNNKKNGAIIIIMQRLHLDDLVGHVLSKGEDWHVINLPAIAEAEETFTYEQLGRQFTIVRKPDSLLHEKREPLTTLDGIRLSMGEAAFAGQYQQSPVPLGGSMIKTDWLQYYQRDELPEKFDVLVQSWDTASKVNQFTDYSICVTVGLKNNVAYIVDVFRAKLEFPALKKASIKLYQHYKPNAILVEDKSSGIQLIQEMKEVGMYQVKPIKPVGDKQTRLFRHAVTFENGRVKILKDAPWTAKYVHELASFPLDKSDDQVDATTQALDYLESQMNEPAFFTFMRMESKRLGINWPSEGGSD